MSDISRAPFASAEEAESAFYAAFEARDLDAMHAVWSTAPDTVCIHPMGQPLRGWPAIARSWTMIFQGLGDARFSLSDRQVLENSGLCVRFAHENIHHGPGYTGLSRVLATNVFRREQHGWRMLIHHASPGGVVNEADPRLGPQPMH